MFLLMLHGLTPGFLCSNTSMQEAMGWRRRSWRRALSCPRCATLCPSTPRQQTHSSRPSSPPSTHKVVQATMHLKHFGAKTYSIIVQERAPAEPCVFDLQSPWLSIASFGSLPVLCVFKMFPMVDFVDMFLLSSLISCAASVPVHNGKGIRLTPNEKIQPSRGRLLPLSFLTRSLFVHFPLFCPSEGDRSTPTPPLHLYPPVVLALHRKSKKLLCLNETTAHWCTWCGCVLPQVQLWTSR